MRFRICAEPTFWQTFSRARVSSKSLNGFPVRMSSKHIAYLFASATDKHQRGDIHMHICSCMYDRISKCRQAITEILLAINIIDVLYQMPNANPIKRKLLELVEIHGLRENRMSAQSKYHKNTFANE